MPETLPYRPKPVSTRFMSLKLPWQKWTCITHGPAAFAGLAGGCSCGAGLQCRDKALRAPRAMSLCPTHLC